MLITLNYHILTTWHTILKINFPNFFREFCKENADIKLVFTSFKIQNYFSYKDSIPDDLKSFLVYKFTCARKIEEHIKKDYKSHSFTDLHSTTTCFGSFNSLSFKITYKANNKFDLKIKEILHINWRKPNLNTTKPFSSHSFTTASVPLVLFCLCLFCFFFSIFLSSVYILFSLFLR